MQSNTSQCLSQQDLLEKSSENSLDSDFSCSKSETYRQTDTTSGLEVEPYSLPVTTYQFWPNCGLNCNKTNKKTINSDLRQNSGSDVITGKSDGFPQSQNHNEFFENVTPVFDHFQSDYHSSKVDSFPGSKPTDCISCSSSHSSRDCLFTETSHLSVNMVKVNVTNDVASHNSATGHESK